MRAAGGRPAEARSASSRSANPAGSHLIRACTALCLGVTHDHHLAAAARRHDQCGCRHPSAQRLLGGPQVGPGEHRRRRRAAVRPGSHHRCAAPPPASPPPATARCGTVASTCPSPLWRTGTPGNARPSSSAVRSSPTLAARSRATGTCRAHPVRRLVRAPAAHRRRTGVLLGQRSGAARAACLLATLLARQRRPIPPPGNLNQHRPGLRRRGSARRGSCGTPVQAPARHADRCRRGRRQRRAARAGARSPVTRAPRAPIASTPGAHPQRCGAYPAISIALCCWWARMRATSRACGYGARCSASRSSPSSQTTSRPRS